MTLYWVSATCHLIDDGGAKEERFYAGPHSHQKKKKGLVRNMKLKCSFGYTDHEIVQFGTQRAVKKEHSKLSTLDFGRVDLGLFRDLLGTVS